VALRPFAPVHLRAARQAGGLGAAWMRRTRLMGDGWGAAEVPLGEQRERYEVAVRQDGAERLRLAVELPEVVLGAAALASAGVTAGPLELRVAQVSDLFGPGAQARITVT
jgi:hypothetical protein